LRLSPATTDDARLGVRPLVVLLIVQLVLGGVLLFLLASGTLKDWVTDSTDDDTPPPAAAAAPAARSAASAGTVDRFDGARAWALLRDQVAVGPRPAGSDALRGLAERLRAQLPGGRFEDVPGHPGLRNIVGSLRGKGKAIVVAAHYDTKDLPDFVGANDGAGGTAAVVELARALKAMRAVRGAPPLRFVLFDGEEATDDRDFLGTGVRGSRAYARAHRKQIRALILLDFVADKDLAIPYESGSDPGLWRRLRSAAKRVGVARHFPDATQGTVEDDHTPFTRRGIPAIDLIDFDFPCWHRPCDDLSAVSERSLDASGEAVLELVQTLRTTWARRS
jgi:glutaminyl-peptide cyclotransferase